MKKLLPLFFVALVLNSTPLECMQRGRSGLSKKELNQACRVARKQADFKSRHPDRVLHGGSSCGTHISNHKLLGLLMIGLLLTPSLVAASPNMEQQVHGAVGSRYVALNATNKLNSIFKSVFSNGYSKRDRELAIAKCIYKNWNQAEMYSNVEQCYHQVLKSFSFEEFIRNLAMSVRENGVDGARLYLEESRENGYAVDSFRYLEDGQGKAKLELNHVLAIDLSQQELTHSLEKIESWPDINELSYVAGFASETLNGNVRSFGALAVFHAVLKSESHGRNPRFFEVKLEHQDHE